MWGFATQTGAGLAIAGLTATYYALAHRNDQGERERFLLEIGHGDGPSVKSNLDVDDSSALSLSSSQMLLKKELEELSALHGSTSGLNILYQPSHPLYRFQRSRFEITPIISRVNTTQSTVFSDSEEDVLRTKTEVLAIDAKEEDPSPVDKVQGQGLPVEDPTEEMEVADDGIPTTEQLSVKEEVIMFNDELAKNLAKNGEKLQSPLKDMLEEDPLRDKPESLQDSLSLGRTTSPICFFKNPGFGSRFAYRMKHENSPVISQALHPASEHIEKKVAQTDSKGVQVSPKQSNGSTSTQFILSPVLSESNMSVCENDTPEKYIRKRKRSWKRVKKVTSARRVEEETASEIEKRNPLDDISEYNRKLRKKMFQNRGEQMKRDFQTGPLIRLRADPEVFNFCRTPKATPSRKGNGKPVLVPQDTGNSPSTDKMKSGKKVSCHEMGVGDVCSSGDAKKPTLTSGEQEEAEDSPGVLEEPLIVPSQVPECRSPSRLSLSTTFSTSATSHVTRIPSDSWIALPIRVYTNSVGEMPWWLMTLCAFVVVIVGFLGMIMTNLANGIAARKQIR